MKTIADIRAENPQYDDMSDQALSDAFYNKYYSDMDKSEFEQQIGLSTRRAETPFDLSPSAEQLLGNVADYIPDPVKGAVETALTMATGATGGALGMMGGTIEGIGRSVAEGKYGTQQGAREAQDTAMKRAGQFTYQPRSKTGQEYVEAIGELTENIPVIPTIAPQLTAMQAGLRAPMKASRFVESTAETIGKVPLIGGSSRNQINQARTKIKNIVSRENPDIQVFAPDGQLTQEAMAVIKQNNLKPEIEGSITPEQAQMVNLFQRYGYQPLRSDITGDIDDQAAKMDALKRTGPVSERVGEQERRTGELYESSIDELTGGGDATDISTGTVIFNSVDDFAAQADEAISAAYNAARDRAGIEGRAVSLDNLVLALRSNKGKDTQSGGVVSALEQELINKGVARLDDKGKLVPIQGANRLLTVDDVEDIRKYANVLFKSSRGNAGATELLRIFKNLMDDSVENAVGSDIFKGARAEKTKYEQTIERSKKNKRDKSRRNLLQNILESTVEPDKIMDRLNNAGIDDFRGVINFLESDLSGEAGTVALNNIKANYLRRILEKSRKAGRVGGQEEITYAPMVKFVNSLQNNGKYDLIFNEQEKAFINDILTITRARGVDKSVALGGGPSSLAVSNVAKIMEAGVLNQIPGNTFIRGMLESLLRNTVVRQREIDQERRLIDFPKDIERTVQQAAEQQSAPR